MAPAKRYAATPAKKVKKGTFLRLIGYVLEHRIRMLFIANYLIIRVNTEIQKYLNISQSQKRRKMMKNIMHLKKRTKIS